MLPHASREIKTYMRQDEFNWHGQVNPRTRRSTGRKRKHTVTHGLTRPNRHTDMWEKDPTGRPTTDDDVNSNKRLTFNRYVRSKQHQRRDETCQCESSTTRDKLQDYILFSSISNERLIEELILHSSQNTCTQA